MNMPVLNPGQQHWQVGGGPGGRVITSLENCIAGALEVTDRPFTNKNGGGEKKKDMIDMEGHVLVLCQKAQGLYNAAMLLCR